MLLCDQLITVQTATTAINAEPFSKLIAPSCKSGWMAELKTFLGVIYANSEEIVWGLPLSSAKNSTEAILIQHG